MCHIDGLEIRTAIQYRGLKKRNRLWGPLYSTYKKEPPQIVLVIVKGPIVHLLQDDSVQGCQLLSSEYTRTSASALPLNVHRLAATSTLNPVHTSRIKKPKSPTPQDLSARRLEVPAPPGNKGPRKWMILQVASPATWDSPNSQAPEFGLSCSLCISRFADWNRLPSLPCFN